MSTLIAMLPPKGGPRNDYRLGSDTMRVDDSGKKLWEVDSGITKLDQVLPSGRFLGLVGSSPMRIYSVDLKRGSALQARFLE